MKPHPFVRFFSPVEAHHVTRYGTRSIIGGSREPLTEEEQRQQAAGSLLVRGAGLLKLDLDHVEAITAAEWATYRREYERALRDGSLRERTEQDWVAFVKPATPKAEKGKAQ